MIRDYVSAQERLFLNKQQFKPLKTEIFWTLSIFCFIVFYIFCLVGYVGGK